MAAVPRAVRTIRQSCAICVDEEALQRLWKLSEGVREGAGVGRSISGVPEGGGSCRWQLTTAQRPPQLGTNKAAQRGTQQARNIPWKRGRRLAKAKDTELLFKGKWHKLIRWMTSSRPFLPSSHLKRLGFPSIAFGNGIRTWVFKSMSWHRPNFLASKTFNLQHRVKSI